MLFLLVPSLSLKHNLGYYRIPFLLQNRYRIFDSFKTNFLLAFALDNKITFALQTSRDSFAVR